MACSDNEFRPYSTPSVLQFLRYHSIHLNQGFLSLKVFKDKPFDRSSIRNSFVNSHAKSFARILSFRSNASCSAYELNKSESFS